MLFAGCRGSRSAADHIELEQNPLRDARPGEFCTYKSLRDGKPGEPPIPEEWTLSVRQVVAGAAKLEVELLGPTRSPPSPSPREPGWSVFLQTKDEALNGSQILRLFHRPELSPRGVRAFLDRDVSRVAGGVREIPVVVQGKTCSGKELTFHFEDPQLLRATYRLVIVDELPAIGLYEAELDEVWISDAPDGERHEERRRDRLELVDWKR
ncbi:MAG: hypothetical protein ACAI25_10070 [Planctomycetota bacterium]